MASFQISRGLEAELPSTKKDGTIYFCNDTGNMFIDVDNNTRVQVHVKNADIAASATKLANSRTIQTNLESTSSASFNGTANITPGITGTLSISHGGTGCTNENDLRKLLKEIGFGYSQWGSETDIADATWWTNLKTWVATANNVELSACIGKTKKVTLSTAVLGTTTHLVRCIGYNCNRDKNNPTKNTLTFETANTLAETTVFGSSDGKWTGSMVRQQCINYYNAFPGKASIATVSIGTATATNSNQNETPAYTDETVFLASDCEHGFPAGHNHANGKGYAASYDEFDKYNTSKTPYQYCTSNTNRKKKHGDSDNDGAYWERSLDYGSYSVACFVNSNGTPNSYYYGDAYGLAPAFVI